MKKNANDLELSISFVDWINQELRKEKDRREEEETRRRQRFWHTSATRITSTIAGSLLLFLKTVCS